MNQKYVWIVFDRWGKILNILEDSPQTAKFAKRLSSRSKNEPIVATIQKFPLAQLETLDSVEEEEQEIIENKEDRQQKLLLDIYNKYGENQPTNIIKEIRTIFSISLKESLTIYNYLKSDNVDLAVEYLNKA